MFGQCHAVHARRLDHHDLRRGMQTERRLPVDSGHDPPFHRGERGGEPVGRVARCNKDRGDPGIVARVGSLAVRWDHDYLRCVAKTNLDHPEIYTRTGSSSVGFCGRLSET